MSIPVSYLMNGAALKIADPNKTRVTAAEWTDFYNMSARELCSKADILQHRATFNLGTQTVYGYPDEMTTMTGIEVTETPGDDGSWRYIREAFEDEFRSMTSAYYPSATLPEFYFADRLGFYLIPRPSATINGGGRVTYFGLPDRITDATSATFQLPEIAQDYVMRRMVIYGLMARHRHAEAERELQQWLIDVEGLQDRMEDRSNDRRSSLRPRRFPYAGMR